MTAAARYGVHVLCPPPEQVVSHTLSVLTTFGDATLAPVYEVPIQIQTTFRDARSSLVAPRPPSGGLSSSGLIELPCSNRLTLSRSTLR